MFDSYLVSVYQEYIFPDISFEVKVYSDNWIEVFSNTGELPVCFAKYFTEA